MDSVATYNKGLDTTEYVLGLMRWMSPDIESIPPKNLSDGVLKTWVLLSIINDVNPPTVLFVDNLDNNLDPMSLNLMVSEIRATTNTQFVVSSVSPYFMDLMDITHLVVAHCDKGNVTYSLPSFDRELSEWVKQFSAGQLFTLGKIT